MATQENEQDGSRVDFLELQAGGSTVVVLEDPRQLYAEAIIVGKPPQAVEVTDEAIKFKQEPVKTASWRQVFEGHVEGIARHTMHRMNVGVVRRLQRVGVPNLNDPQDRDKMTAWSCGLREVAAGEGWQFQGALVPVRVGSFPRPIGPVGR